MSVAAPGGHLRDESAGESGRRRDTVYVLNRFAFKRKSHIMKKSLNDSFQTCYIPLTLSDVRFAGP